MIRDKVLFLIFLILPNYSLACDKQDFLTFVSAEKNKCVALQPIGEIKQNKKNLIIFLNKMHSFDVFNVLKFTLDLIMGINK